MKIYLAGENGKKKIITALWGGENCVKRYLNENISGDSRGGTGLPEPFRRLLENNADIFSGGESRHWVHEASPVKEKVNDESISSRKYNLSKICSSEHNRGGFNLNENIPSGRDTVQREETYRGGFDKTIQKYKPYILESFYYTDEDTERLLPLFGDFLLDSGAFTFMQNSSSHVEWEEYIERYAAFIKKNKIQKYFELDIDSVVGYEKVLEYRNKLETLVGWPCIPVWHKSRGIQEYKKMCDEYDYVAIGGIVTGEITKDQYMAFPKMINEAHKRGTKVHGLGFTYLTLLPKIHFDSVDSTAWTIGNRFGFVYRFNGKTMIKVDAPKGKRLADPRKVALINYTEWIKFQKYAENHL